MGNEYYRGRNFAMAAKRDGRWTEVEEIAATGPEDDWERGVRDFYFAAAPEPGPEKNDA